MDKLIALIHSLGETTPTILIGIIVTSIVLLLAKNKIEFPKKHIWIIWVCLFFSSSLLLGRGIVKGYEYTLKKFREKNKYARLESLIQAEIDILDRFINKKKLSSCYQPTNMGPLKSLERDKIIYLVSGNTNANFKCYNIERWAYFYLCDNLRLLKPNT